MKSKRNFKRSDFLNMIVYQIYPRSFCDSNGDGIGDLNGIISKLDYLKELGVNAVWLSPCYKSPKFDNGYDISDYRDIDPDYGTLEDMKRLIAEMHARGMKLIMDFVANHTSCEHEWFKQARMSVKNPYHDYYIWVKTPPTQWSCCFGGSAWEYNEATEEYYLHSFAVQQPDLNWKNPKVRAEMCAVADFWADLGVDGFRCDVLDYIGKNYEADRMHGDPSMHDYIRQLFGRKKMKKLFTVGECHTTEKDIREICGEDRGELTTVFQFEHFKTGRDGRWLKREFSFDDVKNVLSKWQNFSAKNGLLYTLFTDNHDQPYFISRAGNDDDFRYECATMYAAMFYLLKGIPFIYQGQEFGSASPAYASIEDYNDIETLNYYKEQEASKQYPRYEVMKQIQFGSRDNSRHPVAWSSDESSGYGFGSVKTWLPLNSRAAEINLENDRKSEKSVFEFYQKLLAYRNANETIRQGDFRELSADKKGNNGYFAFERRLGNERIVVAINFDREQKIPLPLDDSYRFVFGNYGEKKPFDEIFRAFEIAVYEKKLSEVKIK